MQLELMYVLMVARNAKRSRSIVVNSQDILREDHALCCQTVLDPSLAENPAKDPQYAESAVDAMRAQKDEVSFYFKIAQIPWKESRQL